jgi:hypothetical protein
MDSHHYPDRFDYPERPCAREEAVGAGEGAAEGEGEDEAAVAALQAVHDHHESQSRYPERGEHGVESVSRLRRCRANVVGSS